MALKTQRMTFGRFISFRPDHPERTAVRTLGRFGETIEAKEWPSRESMARMLRMQGQREHRASDWRPLRGFELKDGEGF